MTTKRLVLLLVVGMAVSVAVTHTRRTTAADPRVRTHRITGVVTAPVADGSVMVSHDAVPGYMPAMTMPFPVGAEVVPLAVGDRVRFALSVTADRVRAHTFEVIGHDAAVAVALRRPAAPVPTRLKKGDALPAFSLTTAEDRSLTPGDLLGQVTAITFIFTRCPVPEFCPLMVKRFQQVQQELESRSAPSAVRLVSVTLDPAFDTPPVLRAYASSKGANPARWQFATGDPGEIARLTSAFSIHVERGGLLIDHTLATAVVDRDGRIAEIWRGNGWSAAEVLDAIRRVAASTD